MKNAYRMTQKMNPADMIEINIGKVPALRWCKMEVERMKAKGSHVEVVHGKNRTNNHAEIWIARAGDEIIRNLSSPEKEIL